MTPGSTAMYRHDLLTKEGEQQLAQRIEAGRAAWETLQTLEEQNTPALTCTDRQNLEQVFLDGLEARQEFVAKNIRLVVMHANNMARSGALNRGPVDVEDLVQEGIFGLDRAVDGFDWRRGFRFSTYASWQIKKIMHLLVDTRAISSAHLPQNLPTLVNAYEAAIAKLELSNMPLSTQNITKESGLTEGRISMARAAISAQNAVYLDAPLTDSGSFTMGDQIADPTTETAFEEILDSKTIEDVLKEALLSEYEKDILCSHFGALGYPLASTAELAKKHGVTSPTILNHYNKILQKINGKFELNSR